MHIKSLKVADLRPGMDQVGKSRGEFFLMPIIDIVDFEEYREIIYGMPWGLMRDYPPYHHDVMVEGLWDTGH